MKVHGSPHRVKDVQLKEMHITHHGSIQLESSFAMPLLEGESGVTIKTTIKSESISDRSLSLLLKLMSSLERDMAEKVFSMDVEEDKIPEVDPL